MIIADCRLQIPDYKKTENMNVSCNNILTWVENQRPIILKTRQSIWNLQFEI
jgi:hypothetical protein